MRTTVALASLSILILSGCNRPQTTKKMAPVSKAISLKTKTHQIDIASYNVLATPIQKDVRMAAIFKEINALDADIVALQEVAPWFEEGLRKNTALRTRYAWPKIIKAEHGLLYLSKLPVLKARGVALPSAQGRKVFYLTVQLPNKQTMTLANVHLDSPLESHKIRTRQLELIKKTLKNQKHAMVLGDFNFGDHEQPESSVLANNYVDIWRHLYPNEPGFTWDMARNWMAVDGAFVGEKSRRLDRVMLRSPDYRGKSASLFGQTATSSASKAVFPSDHYGLLVSIESKSTQ